MGFCDELEDFIDDDSTMAKKELDKVKREQKAERSSESGNILGTSIIIDGFRQEHPKVMEPGTLVNGVP